MALETGVTYIEDLVDTNPVGATDNVDEGDDHIRNIKTAVQGSFPSLGAAAVTKTASEINDTIEFTDILDEDDMASDSATDVASQQSIKAYVDLYTGGIKRTVVNLGTWNMDTVTQQTVAHGLTLANIRSMSVLIIDDSGTHVQYDSYEDYGALTLKKKVFADATNVYIERPNGSDFDSTQYNGTASNRGYIVIEHI